MSELILIASAQSLNLHTLLIKNPPATYLMRVGTDAMEPRLHLGDVVIVDHSLIPQPGQVVVAIYADEFVVRRLVLTPRALLLQPDNEGYPSLAVTADVELWGVVTWSINQLRPKQRPLQQPPRPDVAGQHPQVDVAPPQRGLPCDADVLDSDVSRWVSRQQNKRKI